MPGDELKAQLVALDVDDGELERLLRAGERLETKLMKIAEANGEMMTRAWEHAHHERYLGESMPPARAWPRSTTRFRSA